MTPILNEILEYEGYKIKCIKGLDCRACCFSRMRKNRCPSCIYNFICHNHTTVYLKYVFKKI